MENNKKTAQKSAKDTSAKEEAAQTEEFIISNSNGNGINPTPAESGNDSSWKEGSEQSKQYKSDAGEE